MHSAIPAPDPARFQAAARPSVPPLVFACDASYAMPLATALRSLVECNERSWPLECYVLFDQFPEPTRRRVVSSLPEGSASIHWVPADATAFEHLAAWTNDTRMHYGRLLIASILRPEVKRALYLDADILVLGDLSPLSEIDLEGAPVGAVIDAGVDPLMKKDQLGELNIPRVRDYFNSGVLLMDLERWRDERITERALEYVAGNPETLFPDQNALNVVCDGRWKQLDVRWNFQRHMEQKLSEMSPCQRPAIAHFVTNAKPWDAAIPNVNAALYDAIRTRTHFRRTAATRLRDRILCSWSAAKRVVKRCLGRPT